MRKKLIIGLLTLAIIFNSLIIWKFNKEKNNTANSPHSSLEKNFNQDTIREFNGTDKTKSIYIALNGLVYDVTSGSEFYKPGGPYHYLAGKDSSIELNMVGGSIIKSKYPVIGKYIK